jgi:hypothetical protein
VSEREVLVDERTETGASPTAAATRLAGPGRTSPTANSHGTAGLKGQRPLPERLLSSVGVLGTQRPAGEHEATIAAAAHPDSKAEG